MSFWLDAAVDAAIWGGRGTGVVVAAFVAAAFACNNPLWKEPETAKVAATAAHLKVQDSARYAWFGCTDTNPFSLYQTKVLATNEQGQAVEAIVCRTPFSDENQVIQRTKIKEGNTEKHERNVARVRVVNGIALPG